MIAAAIATTATVEAARSIIPLPSRRLLVRPHNALRTHARALRPHAPPHLGALPPRAFALPAYVCAHAPACSGRSSPGLWIATACGRTYGCSSACLLLPPMAPLPLCPRSRSSTPPAPTRQVSHRDAPGHARALTDSMVSARAAERRRRVGACAESVGPEVTLTNRPASRTLPAQAPESRPGAVPIRRTRRSGRGP
jgi:hypothetical protein